MPNTRPWVLALSSSLQDGASGQEYLDSTQVLEDWQRLHLKGAADWGVRLLATCHPLKGLGPEFAKPKEDKLLSIASGIDCFTCSYKGIPTNLVNLSPATGSSLGEFLSQSYDVAGIESLSWEKHASTLPRVQRSYSLYSTGKYLLESGACAGVYAQHPTEFDAACRLSLESGVPLFANYSPNEINSVLSPGEAAEAGVADAVARGWLTRVRGVLKHASGIVFADEASLRQAFEFGRPAWDEGRLVDYSSISAALGLLSDHRSAVATARWGELAIQERRKAVGLAKGIEEALLQSRISFDSLAIHSQHFCLCPPPLDISPLEEAAASGFDLHSQSALREKLMGQPSLEGANVGRHTKLAYCQAIDAQGLKEFLGAFKSLPLSAGLLLDCGLADTGLDARRLIKENSLGHRTVLLTEQKNPDRVRAQSAADLIVVPSGPKHVPEVFLAPLAACALSRKIGSAHHPALLALGHAPHFLSGLGTGGVMLPSQIESALFEQKERGRLDLEVRHVLSELDSHKSGRKSAAALSAFFKSASMA